MAIDLNQIEAADSTKIVGSAANGAEQTPVQSTLNGEIKSYDVADNGGVDAVIAVMAGAVVELKIGASARASRKYVQIQAKANGVTWGFSVTSQSFDAFKNQFFILPFGPGTSVYLKNNSAASVAIAIAELS